MLFVTQKQSLFFPVRPSFLKNKGLIACYIISNTFHIKTILLSFSIKYRIPSKYSALLITARLHFLALRNIAKQWRIRDFPLGALTRLRDVDLRHGHFLVKMYLKTKELGPVEGVHRARPLDPPMSRTHSTFSSFKTTQFDHGYTKHKIVVIR